mgnify:FL=1
MKSYKNLFPYFVKGLGLGFSILFFGGLIIPPVLPVFVGGLFALTFSVDVANKKDITSTSGSLLFFTVLMSAVLASLTIKLYCLVGLPSTTCKPGYFNGVLFVNLVWPAFMVVFFLLFWVIKKAAERFLEKKK